MPNAIRLDTDMSTCPPVSRHYQVGDGYLTVTCNRLLTATGTLVFAASEFGTPLSMTPIQVFPGGTSFGDALTQLGFTVVDEVGAEPADIPPPAADPPAIESVDQVLDLLPDDMATYLRELFGETNVA